MHVSCSLFPIEVLLMSHTNMMMFFLYFLTALHLPVMRMQLTSKCLNMRIWGLDNYYRRGGLSRKYVGVYGKFYKVPRELYIYSRKLNPTFSSEGVLEVFILKGNFVQFQPPSDNKYQVYYHHLVACYNSNGYRFFAVVATKPRLNSLIPVPIPVPFGFLDSDSSNKLSNSRINS